MSTYLVTGGMGYIGSRVIRRLVDRGDQVVCLDPAGVTAEGQLVLGDDRIAQLTLARTDISDTVEFFRQVEIHHPDVIIHHAMAMAVADYLPSGLKNPGRLSRMLAELNPGYALRINSGGMLNILEAARLFDVRRVVWTSAIAALGLDIADYHDAPIGDHAVFRPDSMYGVTKVVNEVMAKLYFDNYGLDSIGFRIARTYGSTNFATPFTTWNKRVALEEAVELADPDYFNSYIYVEDCAAAHVHAADFDGTTGTRVFNLREGEYSNQQLFDTIASIHPYNNVSLVDGPGDGMPTPRLEATGIRDELKWVPTYPLADALTEIYNVHRAAAGLPLLG